MHRTLPVVILGKSALPEQSDDIPSERDFVVSKCPLCNLATFFFARQGAILEYFLQRVGSSWVFTGSQMPKQTQGCLPARQDCGSFLPDSREANYFQVILPFPICHCCLIDGLGLMRQKSIERIQRLHSMVDISHVTFGRRVDLS